MKKLVLRLKVIAPLLGRRFSGGQFNELLSLYIPKASNMGDPLIELVLKTKDSSKVR